MTKEIKTEKSKNEKKAINGAEILFNIQSELSSVTRSSEGYNYQYADLNSVWNAVQPLLEKNKVVLKSENTHVTNAEGKQSIFLKSSLISIELNEVLSESSIPLSWAKSLTPQDIGAAITYFRRYNLLLLLNVMVEDDDALSIQSKMVSAVAKAAIGDASATLNNSPSNKPMKRQGHGF